MQQTTEMEKWDGMLEERGSNCYDKLSVLINATLNRICGSSADSPVTEVFNMCTDTVGKLYHQDSNS